MMRVTAQMLAAVSALAHAASVGNSAPDYGKNRLTEMPFFTGGGKSRHGWTRRSGVMAMKRAARKRRNQLRAKGRR